MTALCRAAETYASQGADRTTQFLGSICAVFTINTEPPQSYTLRPPPELLGLLRQLMAPVRRVLRPKHGDLTARSSHGPQVEEIVEPVVAEGKHWALLIYCCSFQEQPAIVYAENDVKALRLVLSSCFGFECQSVQVQTKEGCLEALQDLRDKIGPDDVVFVYFATHGSDDGLIFSDYTEGSDAKLAIEEIHAQLAVDFFYHLTIFYDCCRHRPTQCKPARDMVQIHPAGLAFETERLGSEITTEQGTEQLQGHGVFTWCLLKTLCWLASADSGHSGAIEAERLYFWILWTQGSMIHNPRFADLSEAASTPLFLTQPQRPVYFSLQQEQPQHKPVQANFFDRPVHPHGPIINVYIVGGLLWFLLLGTVYAHLWRGQLVSLFFALAWLVVTVSFAFRARLISCPFVDFRQSGTMLQQLEHCHRQLLDNCSRNNIAFLLFSVISEEIRWHRRLVANEGLSLWAVLNRYIRLDIQSVQIDSINRILREARQFIKEDPPPGVVYRNLDSRLVLFCAFVTCYFLLHAFIFF